jgi:hypothetical protein
MLRHNGFGPLCQRIAGKQRDGMTIMKSLAAAVLSLGLSVGGASAATVVLGGPAATAGSFVYTGDGVTVTATGERRDGCLFLCFQDENLSRAADGLGVRGGGLGLDSPELDGQVDERLTFTFSHAVRLISVTFSFIDGDDEYDVLVDVGSGLAPVALDALSNPFLFAADAVGTAFRIAVDGNASAFRVSSITFAPVPLPAGGLLLLGGLAGLAALRRRR